MKKRPVEVIKTKVRTVRTRVQTLAAKVELVILQKDSTLEQVAEGDAQFVAFEHSAIEIVEFFAARG